MNAPTVTIEQVNAAIVGETYTVLPDGRTTICQLTLDNGFTVDGHSACVSKENFNAEDGNKYSREKAVDKVWGCLGFRLADKLARESTNYFDRLLMEEAELSLRYGKLVEFLSSGVILAFEDMSLLKQQEQFMAQYLNILTSRIERAKAN